MVQECFWFRCALCSCFDGIRMLGERDREGMLTSKSMIDPFHACA